MPRNNVVQFKRGARPAFPPYVLRWAELQQAITAHWVSPTTETQANMDRDYKAWRDAAFNDGAWTP